METMNVNTFVLCRNAGGEPEFFVTEVSLPMDQYDLGMHYDIATRQAEDAGYGEPMTPFDEFESAGKEMMKLRAACKEAQPEAPVVMIWIGEGGVEDVVADFPMRYVVVNTDIEYAEDDDVFEVSTGDVVHEALGHTGIGTVRPEEAVFVWNQVRRHAEPDLEQPLIPDEAECAEALGVENPAHMREHQCFLDGIMKHRVRFRRALSALSEGGAK